MENVTVFRPRSRALAALVAASSLAVLLVPVAYLLGLGLLVAGVVGVSAAGLAGLGLWTRRIEWLVGPGGLTRRTFDGPDLSIPWRALESWHDDGRRLVLHLRDGRQFEVADWEVAEPGFTRFVALIEAHNTPDLPLRRAA
ncbi:MAG: hypothetical protein KF696_01480 [Planctomycetes bacterium]|nr:hypothetical protein [Planctomycetota bacterium]MCW8134388.1 hypothetical protein [Planctomycetota bacterium]